MKKLIPLLAMLTFAPPVMAQPAAAPAVQAAPLTEASVRRVDVANGKITLRHGPIVNLDMPPMTMVFTAQSPSLIEGLKAGDQVRFRAESINGVYMVTYIERVP